MDNKIENETLTALVIKVINEKHPQTTNQLISLIKEQTSIQDKEIIRLLFKMQSEGKLNFTKASSPMLKEFTVYLRTEHSQWYWTTIILATVATIIVFIIPDDFQPWIYIRYVLGALLVLWLPGYSLVKALFPIQPKIKKHREKLDVIERTALSLGMSLALVPIVGLFLNYTPWGIRLAPVTLTLLFLTTIFSTVAVIREYYNKVQYSETKV